MQPKLRIMKKFYIVGLLFTLIFLSINVYGQEVPKKANLVILVTDSLRNFDLFKECIMILKSDGYAFDQLDKDFYLCSTKPVKPDKVNMEYRLDISVTENKLEIRSYVKSLDNFYSSSGRVGYGTENAMERGANRSLSKSLWRYGWDKQVNYAHQVRDKISGSIEYIVEGLK